MAPYHISDSFQYKKQGCGVRHGNSSLLLQHGVSSPALSALVLNWEVPLQLRLHRPGLSIRKITSLWGPECAAWHTDVRSALPVVPCSFSLFFFFPLVKIPEEVRIKSRHWSDCLFFTHNWWGLMKQWTSWCEFRCFKQVTQSSQSSPCYYLAEPFWLCWSLTTPVLVCMEERIGISAVWSNVEICWTKIQLFFQF